MFRHETLAHFGLDILLVAYHDAFLAAVARSENYPFIRQVFAKVGKDYPELANNEFKRA
jgi:hypothetical protein